jgi:hypothetical protein
MPEILDYFHHIHHNGGEHEVHHCGGGHKKINEKLDYEIKHCSCGKHSINKKEAVGHDFDYNEVKISFNEECPDGGWHIESGKIISN